MTEHMLAGAETARTIVTQIDRIKLPLHLLMLFYSGLLAHLAGVLSTRIGAEPTEKLLGGRAALMNVTTLAMRIEELDLQHGGLRPAARVLGVDPGYLSRLRSGTKRKPSAKLLRRMGLREVLMYERVR